MLGLDASNVNPEALFRLRLPQVDFAIFKATEGLTFIDRTHDSRVFQARASHKLVGHYHFDRSNDDGVAQARFFVNTARAQPGETLWLDMETTDAQPWATVAGRAADFIRTVNTLTGAKCGLYSDPYELEHVIAATDPTQRSLLEAAPLWIADPSHAQGHPSCPLPWAIHQYGITGGLDANVTNPAFAWASCAIPVAAPAPTPTQPEDADMALLVKSDDPSDLREFVWTACGGLRHIAPAEVPILGRVGVVTNPGNPEVWPAADIASVLTVSDEGATP